MDPIEENATEQLNELKGLEILRMMDPIEKNAAEQFNEFKGFEVLCMMDPIEKNAAQQLTEFDRKRLKLTAKEGLEIEREDKSGGIEVGV